MQRKEPLSPRMLKAARTLAGMTQCQLAEVAGLHPKSVVYWEKRGGIPQKFGQCGLKRILEALSTKGVEISVDYKSCTMLPSCVLD